MSSFKKQAIKLKESLKEKGLSVPLVSLQEALARSYGFNNRHVALQKEKDFDELFSKLHKSVPSAEIKFPPVITKESAQSVNFHFVEEGDDDGYVVSFDEDIDFFSDPGLKDGYKIFVYSETLVDLKIKDIVDTKDLDVEDLFETWEWEYDIENFAAQLIAKSALNQEEYLDGSENDLPKVSFSNFLVDKEALQKAWIKVMKCFSIDGDITVHGLPVFKITGTAYKYDKNSQEYRLVK